MNQQRAHFAKLSIATGLIAAITSWALFHIGVIWAYQFHVVAPFSDAVVPVNFHYITLGWWLVVIVFGAAMRSTTMMSTVLLTGLMLVVAPALVATLTA